MALPQGMSLPTIHPSSSSSGGPDFLNLCQQTVRSIQALLKGEDVLNGRQCRDLSLKLFKTVRSVEELFFHSGGCTDYFRPALKNLYRSFEKARLLVVRCCKEDWVTEAIFQIENGEGFQLILSEVGLCYHAIYEQFKELNEISDAWSFQLCDDLRKSFVFRPAPIGVVHDDQDTLKSRLEGLVSNEQNALQQRLARYLLVSWESISQQSQTNELDLSRVLSCMTEFESTETWGEESYLGNGSFGSVFRTDWMGIKCAKKVFDGVDESSFQKEVSILSRLSHPDIVKFICCGLEKGTGDSFIAMELMEMSLADLISNYDKKETPFPYPEVIDISLQIARGVCYLHSMGVAHRDLKPHNVVVNKLSLSPHLDDQYYNVKVMDFGLSKVMIGEASQFNIMTRPNIGTTHYRAPEVFYRPGKVNWFKADTYSFGVTCAHLLSRKEPFENMNLGKMYGELMNGLRPEVPATCPENLAGLLEDCWNTDPNLRPSFTEICMRLEGAKYELLRGLPPSQGYQQEVRFNSTSYKFIRMAVEEYSAVQRQNFARTDNLIETLQPTLGTFDPLLVMEAIDGRACDHFDSTISNFPSATDVSVYYSTACGDSVSSIAEVADKDIGIDQQAFASEKLEYHTARSEAMMQIGSNLSDKGIRDIDYLANNDYREFSSTPVVRRAYFPHEHRRNFYKEQCRVLKEQLSIAEVLLDKRASPNDAPLAHLFSPQLALTELCRVVKKGQILIEGCEDEPCHKAYLRLAERTVSFVEALKEIVWCMTNVFSMPGVGKSEQNLMKTAALADQKELQASLDIWIDSHSCSAEECGRPLSEHSLLCLAKQIRARVLNDKGDITGIFKADHKSVLWEITQAALEDVRQVGKGSFGTVFETIWLEDPYAKKEFEMNPKEFEKEANALAKLNHPNIVKVLAYSVGSDTCFFLMEIMPCDLRAYMKCRMNRHRIIPPFSIYASIDLMLQISEAMRYLNSQGMVHRDLKAANILVKSLDDSELCKEGYVIAKLADFSLAKCKREITSHLTRENQGTTKWRAPEMFKVAEGADGKSFPWQADVYSFGIVCSEILTGKFPFHHVPFIPSEFYKQITDPLNPLRPELPASCPRGLVSLICECWHTDPGRRPTFEEISRKLRNLKSLQLMKGEYS